MKKTLSLLLTLILVIGALAIAPLSASAAVTPKKPAGAGTQASPYIIKTAAEFNWIAANGKTIGTAGTTASASVGRTVYMELGADINLHGASVSLVEDTTGYGTAGGAKNEWHFNGKGYTISNMTNMLFGSVQANSVIENINFINIQLTDASVNVGMIVGIAPNGVTLKNIVIDSTSVLTGTNASYVGGMVGVVRGANGQTVIENCLNAATITNAKNLDTVNAAGIIAAVEGHKAEIKNCVNLGGVSGNGFVGGIVGQCASTANGTKITDCVNLGNVKSKVAAVGEICGSTATNNVPYTATGCYVRADNPAKYADIRAIVAKTHTCKAESAVCDLPCVLCNLPQSATGHAYANGCDTVCDTCQTERIPEKHLYDNACDATCNVCGAERTPSEHVYDHAADEICNVCNAEKVDPPAEDPTAPDTTTPAPAATEDDGCGSALNSTYAVIALVAVLGFAFVAKKREEN